MAHAHKADRSELRPYFITITIVNWLPVFSDPAYCEIIVSSLAFMREHRGLTEDPAQWKYSSFRAWAIGDMEPFPVDPLER